MLCSVAAKPISSFLLNHLPAIVIEDGTRQTFSMAHIVSWPGIITSATTLDLSPEMSPKTCYNIVLIHFQFPI